MYISFSIPMPTLRGKPVKKVVAKTPRAAKASNKKQVATYKKAMAKKRK